jgi:uncharacterized protein YfiM (DUF2279 family)
MRNLFLWILLWLAMPAAAVFGSAPAEPDSLRASCALLPDVPQWTEAFGDSLVLARIGMGEPEPPALSEREFHPVRFWGGLGAFAAVDLAVMVGLNELWYRDYERGPFHWHDDRDNWAQQDKVGHMLVAYQLARVTGHYGRWSGLTDRQAGLFGAGVSFVFQSQIEILDGKSTQWGASWSDIAANATGSVLGGLQIAYPGLSWYTFKYSYHRSPQYDPRTGYVGNALKDYEGISYWLVLRPERFLPESASARWPDWLAVSIGHSAENLMSARPTPEHPHRRQFYAGLDLDILSSVEWPEPWMRTVAGFLSFVRIPAPALQITPRVKWHWLYW